MFLCMPPMPLHVRDLRPGAGSFWIYLIYVDVRTLPPHGIFSVDAELRFLVSLLDRVHPREKPRSSAAFFLCFRTTLSYRIDPIVVRTTRKRRASRAVYACSGLIDASSLLFPAMYFFDFANPSLA